MTKAKNKKSETYKYKKRYDLKEREITNKSLTYVSFYLLTVLLGGIYILKDDGEKSIFLNYKSAKNGWKIVGMLITFINIIALGRDWEGWSQITSV